MSCETRTLNITSGGENGAPGVGIPEIPGFGTPFSIKLPENKYASPPGMPESLTALYEKLSMVLPPGTLKPNLSPNYSRDVLDGLLSILEKFSPFLMLYKFIIPIIKIIVCIIEVICSLLNPFALPGAIGKLFNECIPEFLALIPVLALPIMVFSMLKMVKEFVGYLSAQVLRLYNAISNNLKAYAKAVDQGEEDSLMSIAKKLSNLFCSFQNLFVGFSVIGSVIKVFQDMFKTLVSFPCGSGSDCCTTDFCPGFLANSPFTRATGQIHYLSKIPNSTPFTFQIPGVGSVDNDIRPDVFQLYDLSSTEVQEFINIVDAYDVTTNPKPIYFPTDAFYTKDTPPRQAAYTVDIELDYNPIVYGHSTINNPPRRIQFKDCVVLLKPYAYFIKNDNSQITTTSGVLSIGGGKGYELNNSILYVPSTTTQATLNNFLITAPNTEVAYTNVKYTFKPGFETLFGKSLITAGCLPTVRQTKTVMNASLGNQIIDKSNLLGAIVFPDLFVVEDILTNELNNLAADLNNANNDKFKKTALDLLNALGSDIDKSLSELIIASFDMYSSDFTLEPEVQFSGHVITVRIDLRDKNSNSLISGLTDVSELIPLIKPMATFGKVGDVTYDGVNFVTTIESPDEGDGELKIEFNGEVFSVYTKPDDPTNPPTIVENVKQYSFVDIVKAVPRYERNETDMARV